MRLAVHNHPLQTDLQRDLVSVSSPTSCSSEVGEKAVEKEGAM